MDPLFEQVLSAYEARAAAERKLMETLSMDEVMRRVDELLISVGPDTGRFLNALIRGFKARKIVEIGTSYGYSTLWLADAARATEGKVISLEIAPNKSAYAAEHIQKAGLASVVEFRIGDALQEMAKLGDEIDFVLIDLWKDLYIPCFDAILPRLAKSAVIVADNMLEPEISRENAAAYRAHIRGVRGVEAVMLPIGSGIDVAHLTR